MDRIEKIRQGRLALADQVAKIYQLQQSFTSSTERTAIFNARENNRTIYAKRMLAQERIIGVQDESRETTANPAARKNGVSVGRLYQIGREDEPKGFGTGFLVAPNILITNHHVFGSPDEAGGCAVNFLHQRDDQGGQVLPGISFALKPETFFYTCEPLDFTLVYVNEQPLTGDIGLQTLSNLKLIETKGKVEINSQLNIIQYPNGGIKKYTTEENFITRIDDQDGVLFYTTDTQPGASGSPCFNSFWEVAALHYTAVPEINGEGQWLTVKGAIWDESMGDEAVHWIANAGKSVSKIINHLKNMDVAVSDQPYVDAILRRSIDPLKPANEISLPINHNPVSAMSPIVMNFNGTTTVYVNTSESNKVPVFPEIISPVSSNGLLFEKKETFDENYSTRKGYDKNFIEGFEIPLPSVSNEREKELYKRFGEENPYIVPYHHYSLVMNKKRRMLMWTASNVDYSEALRDSRDRAALGNGAWRLDKRIPDIYQIQAKEFYDPATLIDKGHIVRRDDNCWAFSVNGQTDTLGIEYANADTFHWTNCTPQHEAFNRDVPPYKGIGLWGVLENAVKEQLEFTRTPADANKDYGQRACVLAGPIFDDDDPEYMEIQFPLRFWKIFAIRSASEGNLVYGFILSQKDNIDGAGIEREGKPRFQRKVIAMQVSLKEIEKEAGVLFDRVLHEADVKAEENMPVELHPDMRNLKAKPELSAKD
jgi:endonuclease G